MHISIPTSSPRALRTESITCDFVVVGGGLSGVCAAVQAARAGLKVVLIQDRPVLGGNASSEVRLWVLGATSHMGNNNRWAREGGVIDEILVENLYRNPEGNALVFDTLLLEMVRNEPNIRLLLNTAVFDLAKSDPESISAVRGFCSQNSTLYKVVAPLFCDASGDGIVGFLAGAAFRIGAEGKAEFDEGFAPVKPTNELLGHSIYFYSKDTGRPVNYVPPSFALQDITCIPRYKQFNSREYGCRLWWIEWGGLSDTVHDTEEIKWELWRIVYGVWNYIKNSGEFADVANLTLEWVGTIPGKRESRRFEGDYILSQRDLVDQREHHDAVSYGGWAIDLHPSEGVYSPKAGCTQWHTKGVYQIPYRCFYSRNLSNLFFAGRIISASHVAFASTRVMATCAHNAQVVGEAAALCLRKNLTPKELGRTAIRELQESLLRTGHYIPGVSLIDPNDLAHTASITASSEYHLDELPPSGATKPLNYSGGMMLPLRKGRAPIVTYQVDVAEATELDAILMASERIGNHTPDRLLARKRISLSPGQGQAVILDFDAEIPAAGYGFYCLEENPAISVHTSDRRITGILSVWQKYNKAVAKSARQSPPQGIGVDTFDFWLPERRPEGENLALSVSPPLHCFGAENLFTGVGRPTSQPNAWVAAITDPLPELTLRWDTPKSVGEIHLVFDTDFDHPMESVLMGHPERVMPFCIPAFSLFTGEGDCLATVEENHQSHHVISLPSSVQTQQVTLRIQRPSVHIPAALFALRCYP